MEAWSLVRGDLNLRNLEGSYNVMASYLGITFIESETICAKKIVSYCDETPFGCNTPTYIQPEQIRAICSWAGPSSASSSQRRRRSRDLLCSSHRLGNRPAAAFNFSMHHALNLHTTRSQFPRRRRVSCLSSTACHRSEDRKEKYVFVSRKELQACV
jgi:hypothetical protein